VIALRATWNIQAANRSSSRTSARPRCKRTSTSCTTSSTSLVGTPQQVAESLVEYYDLGVDIFLIRGFDPLIDAIEYGRELMPLTKKLIAEREKARGVAAE
jgi:alkanesulfonate monooxygenase